MTAVFQPTCRLELLARAPKDSRASERHGVDASLGKGLIKGESLLNNRPA